MLTIATANVNGIRAAFRRGMGAWLEGRSPDVLTMQEVRATDELVAEHLGQEWHVAHAESATKGRSGVAVATRLPVDAVRLGLGSGQDVESGRWAEADVVCPSGEVVTVVSAYVHSGQEGTPKQDEKYAFLDLMTARLAELAAAGRPAVVTGDLNIAHREVDIKNWKGNRTSAGFLPQERAYLDRWFDELGWTDVGRALGGDGPGPYTWWSWRGQAFDNDSGWRIDYQLATPDLAGRAVAAQVDRAEDYASRWSDHAPLVVTYDL